MRPNLGFPVVLTALVALLGTMLAWQHDTGVRLRAQLDRPPAGRDEHLRLEAEHRRLLASQVSPAELARLRAERAAVDTLIAEIAAAKYRAETATHAVAQPPATETAANGPSLEKGPVPARLWRNAGQATPAAAFETALWAAAGGDVDALAGLLCFDAGTQAKVEELFAKLPPVIQRELATPGRLMALLAAKDVPLGSAQILAQFPASTDMRIAAQLTGVDGKSKEAVFSLRPEGPAWRLVVPAGAVARYADWLNAPPDRR